MNRAENLEDVEEGECSPNSEECEEVPPTKKRRTTPKDSYIQTTSVVAEEEVYVGKAEDEEDVSSTLNSSWASKIASQLLCNLESEVVTPTKQTKPRSTCFNCGGEHVLSDCKEEKDFAKIRKAQQEFRTRQQQPNRARYHDSDESSRFRPGRISNDLREALGISVDDIPEYIYRMRRMGFVNGYPPGYLKHAIVKDDSDKLLTFHLVDDTKSRDSTDLSESSRPTLDDRKLHFYMGFNNSYRALRDRERNYKIPPFATYCDFLRESLARKYDEEKSRSTKSRRNKHQKSPEVITLVEEVEDDVIIVDREKSDVDDRTTPNLVDQSCGDVARTPILSLEKETREMGDSIKMELGTPVLSTRRSHADGPKSARLSEGSWHGSKMPGIEKFSVGIVPFSAQEDDSQPRGIFKKIMDTIKNVSFLVLNKCPIADNIERMSATGKSFVDGLLQKFKVVVFSKTYCPYCHKARAALDGQNIKPEAMEWVELDKRKDGEEIQDYLKELTGARSVPRVFIGGKFFGGGDDTAAAANNGKLEKLLREAQAL
ncbi:unnamed protein product [Caenorhabditis auriculariae]|uniref:PSP proline-rich domain-containing protein n=1 Tax=Caenorhabditis auriculariae TaxID=2777116 RepID=A0A8S1GMU1_9PELO|nr:unnamed protein product [Caenorhabditis auriculariae]